MTSHVLRIALSALLLLPLGSINAAETIDELDQRLRVVERKLSGEALTDMVNNLQNTRESLDKLSGQIESMNKRLDELEERQRQMYGELDERLRKLETASSEADQDEANESSQSATVDSDAQGNVDPPDNAAQGANEEQRYSQAFETMRSGNYQAARKQFKALLQDYPKGEFSDNARYWIGESHYVVREFDKAEEAFQVVLDNHANSAKRPDALLKIGFIHYEQDNRDAARSTLQRVVDEYPGSSAAKQARKRLERLSN